MAAISSPAACEKDTAMSSTVNCPSQLLAAMKQACPEALLIQLSTDQVYDGSNAIYQEGAKAAPVNAYGSQKLAFEEEISSAWPKHHIRKRSHKPYLAVFDRDVRAMRNVVNDEEHCIAFAVRSSLIYGPAPPRKCSKGASFVQFLESSIKAAKETSKPFTLFVDEVRIAR